MIDQKLKDQHRVVMLRQATLPAVKGNVLIAAEMVILSVIVDQPARNALKKDEENINAKIALCQRKSRRSSANVVAASGQEDAAKPQATSVSHKTHSLS